MFSRRLPSTRLLSALTRKTFSTTNAALANRAIVFTEHGQPSSVLSALTYPTLPAPAPGTVNIRFILSPINPADINVVEGVYPVKPSPTTSLTSSGLGSKDQAVFIAGNEGLAQVTDVGSGVSGLKKGEWVVMTKAQSGTWSTSRNVQPEDVVRLPGTDGPTVSEVHGATITVNPSTAYNMLHDYTKLGEGDWIIQNGGNSAVGQAVIQIAASMGVKTINLVRKRDNLEKLVQQLEALGATKVLTYDDLADKSIRNTVKEWTGGKDIRLGLNCVSGKETTLMARLLGQDAHLVSYGAMSKQPLSLPTSLYIFKNLQSHGFWQTRWNQTRSKEDKEGLIRTLVDLMEQGKLKEPEHEVLIIRGQESDEEAGQKVRDVITKMAEGHHGKKVLLKIEDVPE